MANMLLRRKPTSMALKPLSPKIAQNLLIHLQQKSRSKRSIIDKGFTLVELIIVMVIVAVLAVIALPLYQNQVLKAKATECNVKAGSILTQVGAEAQISQAAADNLFATLVGDGAETNATVGTENSTSQFCTFSQGTTTFPDYQVDVVGKGDLLNKYSAIGCIDSESGKKDLASNIDPNGSVSAPTAPTCDS